MRAVMQLVRRNAGVALGKCVEALDWGFAELGSAAARGVDVLDDLGARLRDEPTGSDVSEAYADAAVTQHLVLDTLVGESEHLAAYVAAVFGPHAGAG